MRFDVTNQLDIAAPQKDQFTLGDAEIRNAVTYSTHCVNCFVALVKSVNGYVKGRKVDATRWLIDAEIFLATETGEVIDTVRVKQYFSQAN